MGTFILKRKLYVAMYEPKPYIKAIEGLPFVDDAVEVFNDRKYVVNENAILKLFKDPRKYVVPKIFEYERDYTKGQKLQLKDYEGIVCVEITVTGPKEIQFKCNALPGSKLYKVYGPVIEWELSADLKGTVPEVEVIDSTGEIDC